MVCRVVRRMMSSMDELVLCLCSIFFGYLKELSFMEGWGQCDVVVSCVLMLHQILFCFFHKVLHVLQTHSYGTYT